ncbi:sulfurtransferase TusA family protein [Oryzomicrobium sp.]|uniref:sulfurtransferase TusA family protein n=2 Tax=Oryzomicrobium sp. TaxID=1911578 RepID=UPI0025F631CB|nr:sulfurtransferase TusA family protein [Oryzomicrobium sp.]
MPLLPDPASFLHDAMTTPAFDRELDVKGLNCPLPILRTKKTLAEMSSGQVLKVLATDPGSVKDFQAFARQTGNELLGSDEDSQVFSFFLKRK